MAQRMQVRQNISPISNYYTYGTLHILPQHHVYNSKANRNCERFHYLRCPLCSAPFVSRYVLTLTYPTWNKWISCKLNIPSSVWNANSNFEWICKLQLVFVVNRNRTVDQHNPFSRIDTHAKTLKARDDVVAPMSKMMHSQRSYCNSELHKETPSLKTTMKRQSVIPLIKGMSKKKQKSLMAPCESMWEFNFICGLAFFSLSSTTSLWTSSMLTIDSQTDSSDTWCGSNKGCPFTLSHLSLTQTADSADLETADT